MLIVVEAPVPLVDSDQSNEYPAVPPLMVADAEPMVPPAQTLSTLERLIMISGRSITLAESTV